MASTLSDRYPIVSRTSFRRGLNYIGGLIGIGLTYFVLAKSGLALALIHPNASAIWPPTGFALAAIVLWGYRAWPAIFLAAMIANATAAGSIGTAISIATGNSLEALVGAARLFDLGNVFGRRTVRRRQPQRLAPFVTCVPDQRQRSKLGTQCRCRDAKNDRGESASNEYGLGSSGGNAHRGACCRQSSIAG